MSPPDGALTERVMAAHRAFPTGVTVITVITADEPRGLAANAFTSVSMEPPLVLFCVSRSSNTHAHLDVGSVVGVNVLARGQADVVAAFASTGTDKFERVAWHEGSNGAPIIDDAAASFELRVDRSIEAGTHTIFVAEVLDARTGPLPPLVYYSAKFFDVPGFCSPDAKVDVSRVP